MKLRDENGNLMFRDITSDMSRVAKNAAEPIIQERYGRQLGLDMNDMLTDLRADTAAHENNPQKFRELAQLKLEGMMTAVPDDFMDIGETTLDRVGAERTQDHYNQLTQRQTRIEEQKAVSNLGLEIEDNIKTIVASIKSGDTETAVKLAEQSRISASKVEDMGGTSQQRRQMIRDIDTAIHRETMNITADTIIAEGEYNLLEDLQISYTIGKIVEPDKQIVIGGKTMTVREALARRGVTDESLAAIDDIEVRAAVGARARTIANQYSQRNADAAKATAIASELANHMNGSLTASSGKTTEQNMQDAFTSMGLDDQTIIGPQGVAQAQDPNTPLGMLLRNGQVFPSAIVKALTNVATRTPTDVNELGNLLTLWGTGSMGITKDGPVVRPKLPDDINAFWANVNNYAQSYGLEAANEYATALKNGSTVGEDLENSARTRLGNQNKDAYAQIKQRFIDEDVIKDMNPSAIRRLETIARRAYASLPPDEADEYVNTAYETLYAKTSVIMTPSIMGAQMQKRSEFAPERFYQGEMYDQFERIANKKIRTANPNLTLGDDAFLYPSPDSTNSSVTWQVLDRQGQPIINSNGAIYIKSQTINKNQDMATKFGEAMAEKLSNARALRDRIKVEGSNLREAKEKSGLNFGAGVIDSLLGRQ